MKRSYVALAINVVLVSALVFLTINAIDLVRQDGSEASGWLIFGPAGTFMGIMPLVWLFIVLAADSIWILFFIIWLLRHKLHIKSRDDTLRLP